MWPLQSSDLQIPRFGLAEEVRRIAHEYIRRNPLPLHQHGAEDDRPQTNASQPESRLESDDLSEDEGLPDSLLNAMALRESALLEHALDVLYQRRDAVAPSMQIRLRPASWESLLSAMAATNAVNPT